MLSEGTASRLGWPSRSRSIPTCGTVLDPSPSDCPGTMSAPRLRRCIDLNSGQGFFDSAAPRGAAALRMTKDNLVMLSEGTASRLGWPSRSRSIPTCGTDLYPSPSDCPGMMSAPPLHRFEQRAGILRLRRAPRRGCAQNDKRRPCHAERRDGQPLRLAVPQSKHPHRWHRP